LFGMAREKSEIKEIAGTDSTLISNALSARDDAQNMDFMRLFTILKRNIEKRDALIEKAKSLKVSNYKKEIEQLIDLMKTENEFLRTALFSDQAISGAVGSVRAAPSVRAESVYNGSKTKIDSYMEIVDEFIEGEKSAETALSAFLSKRTVLVMLEKEKKRLQTIVGDMDKEMTKKQKTSVKK
jgi:hypothetical protein